MRAKAFVCAAGLLAGRLEAQCADGSAPPCRVASSPATPRAAPHPLSIAVLPFANRSPDTADAYLAEGLAEEVYGRLTQLGRLQVRASGVVGAQWRRTPDAFETARRVGVAWFVQGTVRHFGEQLLVSVELVRVATGEATWAARFPRRDVDIFAVQAEVAESVAVQVGGRLTPGERAVLARRLTSDNEAYRLYLSGNVLMARRTQEDTRLAVSAYSQAITRDPRFAAAWARLGYARTIQFSFGWREGLPRDSLLALGAAAAERALSLDSTAADAWLAAGYVQYHRGQLWLAHGSYDRALRLDSLSPELYFVIGALYGTDAYGVSLPAVANPWYRRALALDPALRNAWRHLAFVARTEGRLADAEALWDTANSFGAWGPGLLGRADTRFLRGNGPGAIADVEAAAAIGPLPLTPLDELQSLYAVAAGDSAPARAALVRLRAAADSGRAVYASLARFSMALGLREEAVAALEQLRRWPNPIEALCGPGLACSASIATWRQLRYPLFAPLNGDPRIERLREETRPRLPWLEGAGTPVR